MSVVRKPLLRLLLATLVALSTIIFVSNVFVISSSTRAWDRVRTKDQGAHVHSYKRLDWNDEEITLKNWTWGPMEPHHSLVTNLATLSETDLRLRNWLLDLRSSNTDYSVGLGRATPAPLTRNSINLKDAVSNSSLSLRQRSFQSSGPEPFQTGDVRKYENLVIEWESGQPVSVCQKGNWEESYERLHQGMLQGTIPPKLLTYNCDHLKKRCGGLADRLLGIISIFLYSIISNRAFSIKWSQPIDFSLAFDSPHIDWSHPYTATLQSLHPIYGNPNLLSKIQDYNLINYDIGRLRAFIPRMDDWLADSKVWIRVMLNRGIAFRSFDYPEIRTKLEALGFHHDTVFACLAKYLLRPRPAVMDYVNHHSSFFALPSIYSIGIQVRTGDKSMGNAEFDTINTVERWKAWFDCAEAVGNRFASKPGQKVIYYLISDSNHLKQDASSIYGDSMVMSDFGVSHFDGKDEENPAEILLLNSIAEMWTFAEVDFAIITRRSGFGKVATWLRSKPNSTVAISSRAGVPQPNCSEDIALMGVQDALLSEWSLG